MWFIPLTHWINLRGMQTTTVWLTNTSSRLKPRPSCLPLLPRLVIRGSNNRNLVRSRSSLHKTDVSILKKCFPLATKIQRKISCLLIDSPPIVWRHRQRYVLENERLCTNCLQEYRLLSCCSRHHVHSSYRNGIKGPWWMLTSPFWSSSNIETQTWSM